MERSTQTSRLDNSFVELEINDGEKFVDEFGQRFTAKWSREKDGTKRVLTLRCDNGLIYSVGAYEHCLKDLGMERVYEQK